MEGRVIQFHNDFKVGSLNFSIYLEEGRGHSILAGIVTGEGGGGLTQFSVTQFIRIPDSIPLISST